MRLRMANANATNASPSGANDTHSTAFQPQADNRPPIARMARMDLTGFITSPTVTVRRPP